MLHSYTNIRFFVFLLFLHWVDLLKYFDPTSEIDFIAMNLHCFRTVLYQGKFNQMLDTILATPRVIVAQRHKQWNTYCNAHCSRHLALVMI